MEFTGEIHLGDAESVRDRKVPGTDKPLSAGPVPIRQAAEQRADVSGEIDLFGDYTDGVLNLNAKIPDARIVIKQLPDKKLPSLKENPDVLLVHPGERPHPPGREPEEVEAEEQARKTAKFRMHAHLDLNHLYVKAADFEFPVQSRMSFEYDASRTDGLTADGTVHIPQGSFTALGRRFSIDDAKIIETGGDPSNPELEIKAIYDNPQAKVTITVTGTAKDPQLEMSSTPPMDQDQIAFFLATGRIQGRATQQGGGVDLSGAATSVVGSLLFGQVRKELADVLPVDVITIDTGAQGVSGASVGKYIGDRVFIGYRQRFTETPYENTVEGHLEYEISRTVSAEMTYGDRTRDFSVLFTKDF
jgi:translocation and assembly module TamB